MNCGGAPRDPRRMAELTAGQETPMAMSEAEKRELAARKEEAAAQQAYQIRLDLAVQLAGIEAERISKEENAAKRSVLAAQAQKDLFTELAQAQDQFEEKQAQIQQKRQQEIQSQIDGLQKQAEKLFDVLFTKPKNFGKDLLNTIHSAVLKPVTETLGGAVANVLHPIIYGSDGQGGLSWHVARHIAGSGARLHRHEHAGDHAEQRGDGGLTAILAAGMGVAAPSVSGGAAGVAVAISIPSISAASAGMRGCDRREHANRCMRSEAARSLRADALERWRGRITVRERGHRRISPAPWAAGGGRWVRRSAGTPTLNRAPGGTGGFNPLAMLFGGARGARWWEWANGLAGIVSNLKGTLGKLQGARLIRLRHRMRTATMSRPEIPAARSRA